MIAAVALVAIGLPFKTKGCRLEDISGTAPRAGSTR